MRIFFTILLLVTCLTPVLTYGADKTPTKASVTKSAKTSAKTQAKKNAKVDYNCKDFATQKEAQELFVKYGSPQKDSYRLDADKDAIACEYLK